MAGKIIWSRQAREDLRDIVTFIAQDDPFIAEKFACRLMSRVESLTNFPEMGRVVPEEQDKNVREIVVRPYRIIYQLQAEGQMIAIARIWHGARGEPEIPGHLDF
jgi:plasmid stabilization system protein ParE